jgi:hypothetical protein
MTDQESNYVTIDEKSGKIEFIQSREEKEPGESSSPIFGFKDNILNSLAQTKSTIDQLNEFVHEACVKYQSNKSNESELSI